MDPTNGKLRVMAEIRQTPVPWNVEKSAALRDQRQRQNVSDLLLNFFLPFLIQHMFTQLPQLCPPHAINISISYHFSSPISKTPFLSPSEHKA
jgi:hypothetical protein